MVLIMTPALDGLKREWREAARDPRRQRVRSTGATSRCRSSGRALLGTTLLLFANAFGAIATAYALTGCSLNIVTDPALRPDPRRRAAQPEPRLRAGARHDRHHRPLERRLHLAARAQRAVAAMKQPTLGPWIAFAPRRALLLRAADRDLRVLAAHAARRLQLRRLPHRASRDPRFQATFGYSTLAGAGHDRRRRAPGRADRLLGPAAPAAAAADGRVHHAAAAGHPGDRHRLRLPPALQHAPRGCR